jgi:Leucine Rich repeat
MYILKKIIADLNVGKDVKEIWLNSKCTGSNTGKNPLEQALQNWWNNWIGDEGAKALAQALQSNNTVTTIHLSSNQIGDEGAKALAQALQNNNTVTAINLYRNEIGDELLNDINKLLEKNILQLEELSKKIDQGIDSVQEKLVFGDNIKAEERQEISKRIQQIKEIVQKQKLEQKEDVHDTVLAQINNCKNDVLKARGNKEIQQLVKEFKYDVMLVKLKKMHQSQQTEHSSGTKIISDPNLKLLLSSNPDDLYKALGNLLIGDITSLSEGV